MMLIEGYEAGDPKRLDPFDDDSLKAYTFKRRTDEVRGRSNRHIQRKLCRNMPRDKALKTIRIFCNQIGASSTTTIKI